jgi:hypothetical protein
MRTLTFITLELVAILLLTLCIYQGGAILYFGSKVCLGLMIGIPIMVFGREDKQTYTKVCTRNGKTYSVEARNEKEAIKMMVKLANKK